MSPRLVSCLVIGFAALSQTALGAGLVTEDFRIPMAEAGPEGLEAVLVKPNTPGRHPLALVSHGSPRNPEGRPQYHARGMVPQLTEFARRGFVAVTFMRRGYGSSPGGWADAYGPCGDPDYVKAGRAGAADLKIAISALSRRADVDPSKIIAVGVSAGGFATIALTADPPPGLVAAISFAGGRGSRGPDSVCHDARLVDAFRTFGATSRVPMLWVYAHNDHFFGPALATRLFEAFTGAGGRAEIERIGDYGTEGHVVFTAEGRSVWTPIVDAWLARRHLLPPRPVAAVRNLDPPPGLGMKGRIDFRTFLDAAPHKAFAIGATGAYAWRTGRATTKEAIYAALERCRAESHRPCRVYAVDDAYAPPR